jgi:hypothetical protein
MSLRKWSFVVVVACVASLWTFEVHAFKLKTHIMIANRARDAILSRNSLVFPGLPEIPVNNSFALEAIRSKPQFFRAGVLGPDAFPDLIGGQLWVHTNNGEVECQQVPDDPTRCVPSETPMEARPVSKWRSVDYGMYLLQRAFDYRKDEWSREAYGARLEAVAFAYGYLTHMIGDGFAHSYVNEWTRTAWDYFSGRQGALYGPMTEEIQHMAVEAYLDFHMPEVSEEELTIAAPASFLNSVYLSETRYGDRVEPNGSFGGAYYMKLIGIRDLLSRLADRRNWTQGLPAPVASLARSVLTLHGIVASTIPFGIGDPVLDIEDFFRRRALIVDTLLTRWVELSGCVAQNLLRGSVREPFQRLEVDACAVIDFESDAEVTSLFRGDLNEAAHFGEYERSYDFGTVGANVKKIRLFVQAIVSRALDFQPLNDLRSLRLLADQVRYCDQSLVDWPSCEAACQKVGDACVDAACFGCPENDSGGYTCSGWRNFPVCVFMPHCAVCALDAVDGACVVARNGALPVCEICSTNSLCATFSQARDLVDNTQNLVRALLNQVISSAVEQAKQKLLETYLGPYGEDFLKVLEAFERRRMSATADWFVNFAFLKEDLHQNLAQLDTMIKYMAGVTFQTVSTATSASLASLESARRTRIQGRNALRSVISAASDAHYDRIWRGLLRHLYRIVLEAQFTQPYALSGYEYSWLDAFTFVDPDESYNTRFGRLSALLANLGALMEVRGPTAWALRKSFLLDPTVFDAGTQRIDPMAFHPVHNAIELTKLGFLGGSGIDYLIRNAPRDVREPLTPPYSFATMPTGASYLTTPSTTSAICGTRPHVICDAIQSLDDPNHQGHLAEAGSAIPNATTQDADRSVALWEARDRQWALVPEPGWQTDCRLGLTDFVFGRTLTRARRIYNRIFLMPERCTSSSLW